MQSKSEGFCDRLVDALGAGLGRSKLRRLRERARLWHLPAAALKRRLKGQPPMFLEKAELVDAILDQELEFPAAPASSAKTSPKSAPAPARGPTRAAAEALSIAELKQRLRALGVSYHHCLERRELEAQPLVPQSVIETLSSALVPVGSSFGPLFGPEVTGAHGTLAAPLSERVPKVKEVSLLRAGHATRWARCRNAHLSSFARQVNLGLQGHRGLSSCPALTRICAEMRPVQGFVEQRTKTPGALSRLLSGDGLENLDGSSSQQAVAELLESVIAASLGNGGSSLSEARHPSPSCPVVLFPFFFGKGSL
ncbi:unnamed protein product [Effrenium voratum]|nr:unnamed protein product [Effrenium voratum]